MALSKLPEANAVELFRSNTLQTPFITTDSSLDWICNTTGLRGRRRGTVVCFFSFVTVSNTFDQIQLLHGRRHGTGSNTSSSRLTQGWGRNRFVFTPTRRNTTTSHHLPYKRSPHTEQSSWPCWLQAATTPPPPHTAACELRHTS